MTFLNPLRAAASAAPRFTDTHRRVYQLVRTLGPLSRADVVRITGLTFPTISRIIAELVAADVLEETRVRRGGMGKPPIDLALRPEHAFSVGLVSRGETLQGVIVDAAGTIHNRAEVSATDKPFPDAAKEALAALAPTVRPIGAGVLCVGEPLSQAELEPVQQALGMPAYAESRAGAGALLERYFGAARTCDSFVYLEVEDGVSSAVMLGDRLIAPVDQLSGLLEILGGGNRSADWSELLPSLTQALLVTEKLLRPEAFVVGGNVGEAELDALGQALRGNSQQESVSYQVLKGVETSDRLTLAAATLPLYAAFATTS